MLVRDGKMQEAAAAGSVGHAGDSGRAMPPASKGNAAGPSSHTPSGRGPAVDSGDDPAWCFLNSINRSNPPVQARARCCEASGGHGSKRTALIPPRTQIVVSLSLQVLGALLNV